jgi:hypothetical protein
VKKRGKPAGLSAQTRRLMSEAEAEFGMKFLDIIKDLAESGEGRAAVAGMIGMSKNTLLRILESENFDFSVFPEPTQCNSYKQSSRARPTLKDTSRLAKANPYYRWVEIDGVRDTILGHSKRNGISHRTVFNRIYRGVPVERALMRAGMHKTPNNKNHVWRSYGSTAE